MAKVKLTTADKKIKFDCSGFQMTSHIGADNT